MLPLLASMPSCFFLVVALGEPEVSVLDGSSITVVVKWLAVAVLSFDSALVGFILYRRASRNRFYRLRDAAQGRFSGTLQAYLAGAITLEHATALLKTVGRPEREAAKKVLLGAIHTRTSSAATELLLELGFVQEWSEQAFGKRRTRQILRAIQEGCRLPASHGGADGVTLRHIRRLRLFSISRAVAVGHLGRLSPEYSGIFMREALRDPSPYVARMAVAGIGRNRIQNGIPVLLEELRRAVRGETELPIRSIKTALVRYPVSDLDHFVAFMEEPNSRFRFLAVDTIREICHKALATSHVASDFPLVLRRWFLEAAVRDDSADVRARSAVVVGYFRDPSATEALRVLLRDDNEFVRLHAVRACGDPYYADLIGDILQRITDEKWRVREAAVRMLAGFDRFGWRQLQTVLVNTSDRYASEQIIDELQRSGVVQEVVSELFSSDSGNQAVDVCSKMVHVGMVSSLTDQLNGNHPLRVRTRLFEVLSKSEAPQFVWALQRIVDSENDPLKSRAELLLRQRQGNAASAAAERA